MAEVSDRAAAPSAHKRQELFLRVISALVLGPLVLLTTWYGGWPFAALIMAGAALVLFEWTGLCGRSPSLVLEGGTGLAILAAIGAVMADRLDIAAGLLAVAVGVAVVAAAFSRRAPWLASGLLYAGVSGGALVLLRRGDAGLVALVFLFAVVWMTDIAAYFVGRTLGGPKLWPAVSPNKTWSGAIGGLAGGTIAGAATAFFAGFGLPLGVIAVAIAISVSGQAGDLAESAIKRHFGKKDSGHLIPGHGGLMDRADALVFGAVVAALVGALRAGWHEPATGLFMW